MINLKNSFKSYPSTVSNSENNKINSRSCTDQIQFPQQIPMANTSSKCRLSELMPLLAYKLTYKLVQTAEKEESREQEEREKKKLIESSMLAQFF